MRKNPDSVNIRGIAVMRDDGKLNLASPRTKPLDRILDIPFPVDMDYRTGGSNEKTPYYRNKECSSSFCGCFTPHERPTLTSLSECQAFFLL